MQLKEHKRVRQISNERIEEGSEELKKIKKVKHLGATRYKCIAVDPYRNKTVRDGRPSLSVMSLRIFSSQRTFGVVAYFDVIFFVSRKGEESYKILESGSGS